MGTVAEAGEMAAWRAMLHVTQIQKEKRKICTGCARTFCLYTPQESGKRGYYHQRGVEPVEIWVPK